jgi:hypothetical protein
VRPGIRRSFPSGRELSPLAPPPARSAGHRIGRHQEARSERWGPQAYIVRYEEATERAYLVQALHDAQMIKVPKSYAPVEPFPLISGKHARGVRVLRWSGYALLAVGPGGLVGVLLGFLVVLAAGIQLVRFSWRVRRWRRGRQGASGIHPLPASASAERLRLLGALGQGLLAVALGSLLLVLLTWHLL